MPKVTYTFHRDPSQIGKTVEVSEDEARVLISENRAVLASKSGHEALRRPPGPTVTPPLPTVAGTAADVRAAQDAGRIGTTNEQEAAER